MIKCGVWGDETWHFGGVFFLGNGRFQAVFCKKKHFFSYEQSVIKKGKMLLFNTFTKTDNAFFFLIYSLYNNNSRKEKEKLLLMLVMIQTNSGIHLTA